tara:strand:+ start:12918 stop:14633 length:1716 start_codon:yes stop_codon:yes gene_type:complete
VLTQAAGPGEFISRLWKRDPAPQKEEAHSLNPFKFLRRENSDSTVRRIKVSDGGRSVVSQRPKLVNDPFLTERAPLASTPAASGSKGIIVRPEPRQSPVKMQTAEHHPSVTERNSRHTASNVDLAPLLNSSSRGESSRVVTDATRSLPERTADASPSAGNSQFVSGFDSEFQKLFQEVIEESRQTKASTTIPRLPDDAVASSAAAAPLPEVVTSDEDDLKKDFAEFAQQRSRTQIDSLIQESRNQMESSALARRANSELFSPPLSSRQPDSQQTSGPLSSVSAVAHSDSKHPTAASLPESEARFIPQTLPDRLPLQTSNELVVPSSMVPDRSLFTTSDGWLPRDESEHPTVPENAPHPQLQPVVQVVPGQRGAGVVIESGQWSPIQPRVTSNVAPVRSVPDTSQFRRLSFEGVDSPSSNGAVQAIGNGTPDEGSLNTDDRHAGQYSGASTLILPAMPNTTSTASTASTASTVDGSELAMIIPDSRTGQSLDASKLGAAFATAPAPPQSSGFDFDWPDETELAAETPDSGLSWGATMFLLAIAGGVIGLFIRRKAQDSVFGITGTGTRSEIS